MFLGSMNFDLGDDVNALREMVHAWAQKLGEPLAAETDRSNAFPNGALAEMGEPGLLGITRGGGVRRRRDGLPRPYVARLEEISRVSASIGLSYGAHSNLCVNQIKLNGTAEQKAQYLPKLVSGAHVGALACPEAGAGSDVVGMKLRAEKRNDRYVLNGTNTGFTNGPDADTLVVYAKTDLGGGVQGHHRLHCREDHEGLQHLAAFDKMGMRGSNTAELVFEDGRCRSRRAGEGGRGVRVLMSGLDYERVVLSGVTSASWPARIDDGDALSMDRARKFRSPVSASFQLCRPRSPTCTRRMNTARAYSYEVRQGLRPGRACTAAGCGGLRALCLGERG